MNAPDAAHRTAPAPTPSAAVGYWRARTTSGQEWRREIANWRYVISTVSVVIAHVALTAIATLSLFAVLARSFIGAELNAFWTTVLLGVTAGLAAWLTYLSASRITTQRLTSLLVSFIAIGTVAAMLTTSDPTRGPRRLDRPVRDRLLRAARTTRRERRHPSDDRQRSGVPLALLRRLQDARTVGEPAADQEGDEDDA